MKDNDLERLLSGVVGGKSATALRKAFGMVTVNDLLRHYPRRYAQRGELTDLSTLTDGESVTVLAEIEQVTVRPMKARRGSIVEAIVTDGRGRLSVTFFNQAWRERELRPGRSGLFSGQVSTFRTTRQLAQPQCLLFPEGASDDQEAIAAFAGALIPVYPATGSLTSWQIAGAVRVVLDTLGDVADPIPDEVRAAESLLDLKQALRLVHRPADFNEVETARARIKYEEAFVFQVVLAQRRQQIAHLTATSRSVAGGPMSTAFDERLPFVLTAGQVQVSEQIAHDLAGTHPMHRLLQGDVGSGKTIVALRAMLSVVDAGGQAALLAPTEVLAAQHYRSIRSLLGPLADRGRLGGADGGTRVALLTGSQRTAQRRVELLDVITGEAGIVVGTHALIQDTVEFRDLALVVVDEQHRFGVEQRAALAAKARDGTRPHVLVMTATPIPRTVAMTVFGDLDISTLSELPAGRIPIATHVIAPREQPGHLTRAWERLREEAAQKHRIFVVCPRIGGTGAEDESAQEAAETSTASVLDVTQTLTRDLPDLRVAMLHGRMSGDEKEDVMARFADISRADGIDVLVSTTVIEVGVDVPDATTMIILDADRFGISQLHQLRGRVGRGAFPGLCLLVTEAEAGSPSRERLLAVASTTDGFKLSQLDLEMRREGDVLGSMQSGRRSSLRMLEVVRDEHIIERARAAAHEVVENDPELVAHSALRLAIEALVEGEQAEFMEKA